MTIGRSARILLGAVVALLCTCAGAAAQTNDEVFPNLQWNFSTPGARANGMGRAFIGLADDATATVSNPAGLVSLTKPQMYVEYKNTDLKVDRLATVNSLSTLNPTTFTTDINALSFFNISMPVGTRFAVGLTRHQFLNYQENFNLAARSIPNNPTNSVLDAINGNANFKGAEYGLTVSAALSDKLSAGVTLGIDTLSANSTATRSDTVFGPTYPLPPATSGNFNDLAGSPVIANQTTINQSNTAASFGFGLLAKPSDKISIGFNFVQGPKFTVAENLEQNFGSVMSNGCFTTTSCGTNQPLAQTQVPAGFAPFPVAVHINVPTRYGLGVAARPSARWLFAFDVVRINYSSLSDSVTPIFFGFDNATCPAGATVITPACTAQKALTGSEYSMPNVTEVHFGGEYSLSTGSHPIFVRAGVFTNPDHRVKFLGFQNSALPAADVAAFNSVENATYNLLPRTGDTRATIGAGIALGQQMQVDLAYVIGEEFVASTALRFK